MLGPSTVTFEGILVIKLSFAVPVLVLAVMLATPQSGPAVTTPPVLTTATAVTSDFHVTWLVMSLVAGG